MSIKSEISAETAETVTADRRRAALRRFLSHKGLMIGITLVSLTLIAAIFAPLIAPHDPYLQDIAQRRIPPIW